jgi:hypothetical protein
VANGTWLRGSDSLLYRALEVKNMKLLELRGGTSGVGYLHHLTGSGRNGFAGALRAPGRVPSLPGS